ncbi:hypothetical protein MTO96_022536 [Rhipicephalus appendiculatus]
MPITLYNVTGSPPCAFIRTLAKKLGVELELKNLDFLKKEHLTPEYLKINPFHKVPTLDDSGFIVYESNAIAYYLLRKYAPKSELYPECVKHRTRIDQVLAAVASTIAPHKMTFIKPLMTEKRKPTSEEVAAFEANVLKGFEHLIGDGKVRCWRPVHAGRSLPVLKHGWNIRDAFRRQGQVFEVAQLLRACFARNYWLRRDLQAGHHCHAGTRA